MYSLIPFRRNVNTGVLSPFATDHFFRSFFDMSDMMGSAGFRVDVREEEDGYKLEAELPGLPKEKINICVDDGTLTINADLNEEKKEERGGYLYSERRSGHVERRFNLEGIKTDDIAADYQNGVLTVTLPKEKAEEKGTEARKIEVQ